MRATEKNSTDLAMGRRPVSVARRTNSVARMVEKLENTRFDWPNIEIYLGVLLDHGIEVLKHLIGSWSLEWSLTVEYQQCVGYELADVVTD
jgi:hypothetical protein